MVQYDPSTYSTVVGYLGASDTYHVILDGADDISWTGYLQKVGEAEFAIGSDEIVQYECVIACTSAITVGSV